MGHREPRHQEEGHHHKKEAWHSATVGASSNSISRPPRETRAPHPLPGLGEQDRAKTKGPLVERVGMGTELDPCPPRAGPDW